MRCHAYIAIFGLLACDPAPRTADQSEGSSGTTDAGASQDDAGDSCRVKDGGLVPSFEQRECMSTRCDLGPRPTPCDVACESEHYLALADCFERVCHASGRACLQRCTVPCSVAMESCRAPCSKESDPTYCIESCGYTFYRCISDCYLD